MFLMTQSKYFVSPLLSSTPKPIHGNLLSPYEWAVKHNSQTRVYGVYLGLYSWILWCCDHYQLDLVISIVVIITGALFLWLKYPNTDTISQTIFRAEEPAQSRCHGHQQNHLYEENEEEIEELGHDIPSEDIPSITQSLQISTSSVMLSSAVVSSISLEYHNSSSEEPVLMLAQEPVPAVASHSRASQIEEVCLEEIPAYPPPPYYKSKAMESPKPNTQPNDHNHDHNYNYDNSHNHDHHMLYYYGCTYLHYLCLNLAICGLGACGWILCLELWMCESWICPQSLAIDWPQPIPELVNSLACAVVVSSFVAIVHVVLPRLCYFTQSKLTFVTEATAVDAATILPICIAAESNEKGGVQFERTPVPVEREHINAVAGALQECEPQIAGTDVEPKSDLAEAHLNVSCQRKIGRAAKKREGVATIRKRSSSLTLEIALSPFKIPAPVRMVKSKLKVLGVLLPVFAPTIVPRPRSWTFPKTKSRESSHTYSQTTRDQVEDKITLKKDLQQDIEDATLCKTNDSSSTKPELSLIRANDRLLSPSASGLALWKLARMALDLERLDSIIHFYKHKHIAATETPESSKYASQEKDELAFVVRSSRLPTVRVGLYGATQKRLWTSTGSIDMASAEYLKESNAAYKPTFNVQL